MVILKNLSPILIAALCVSCTEIFDPDVEQEPVICLNSHIIAGQPITVQVTHTWKYNDSEAEKEHSVPDAQVTVYANGRAVDADYLAAEGDYIVIEARSDQYGYATADVIVPHAVPQASVIFTPVLTSGWVNPESEKGFDASLMFELNAELTFDDPAESSDYYRCAYSGFNNCGGAGKIDPSFSGMTGVNGEERCLFFSGSLDYEAEPLFSEHIDEFESVMGSDTFGFSFFSDRQINGSNYTLKLKYTNLRYSLSASEFEDKWTDCGLRVTLCSISTSYYNWLRYCWAAENGIIGDLGDLGIANPIWGYSNVSTRAGVVVAEARAECVINLKDFITESIANSQSGNPSHSDNHSQSVNSSRPRK